jgi:ABC-type Fe3+/spermidine/putrescine transport system ATPase subunit/nucleotide-binding universal stress UspA family protein
MTVAENIAFGLRIRQIKAAEQKNRVEELMDIVGLTGLGGRYASQLSGGQQQRVALARALAYQPAVILLDEPFGALDVKIRAQLRASFKAIQRRLNVTTILVTHDQEEAFELADRIGVVDRGSLIEVGTAEALYYRPQKEFTAAFIGGGNVMVGRTEANQIRLGSVELPFPPQAPPHEEYSSARIVFRPEAVVLTNEDAPPLEGFFPLGQGRVVERVFSGAFERIRVEVDSLRGARTVMPRLQFGQHAPQIQVQFKGDANVVPIAAGQPVQVWLRDYHVIEPGGLRILIDSGLSTQEGTAVEFGGYLAAAVNASGTLLMIGRENEAPADSQARLTLLKHRYQAEAPRIETAVSKGSAAESVLRLFHENHYELIITDRENGLRGSLAWHLLAQTQTPVLLTGNKQLPVERILICTAAGEPGKSDIRFGGRLGQLLGARVTLFHVNSPVATIEELSRTENHLGQGQALLAGIGLACDYKTAENEKPVEGILKEIAAENYGLIVIGAPAPRPAERFLWSDLAIQIVSGTTRPVLIVPMYE